MSTNFITTTFKYLRKRALFQCLIILFAVINLLIGLPSKAYATTPDEISGLQLWYKADAISGLSDGTAVSSWVDSSGNSNNAAQAIGAKQPLYKTGVINGLPVVRFDGTDDFMSFSNVSNIRTVFAVVKWTGAYNDYAPIMGHSSLYNFHGNAGNLLFSPVNASSSILGGSAYVNGTSTPVTSLTKPSEFKVISIITTGNVSAEYITNDRNAQGRVWRGDYAELIIYNSALSSSDRASIETYLSSKYNIGDANTPTEPNDLYATPSSGQVTLSWTVPTNNGGSTITDYKIEYRTGSNDFVVFSDGVSTITNTVVTGLTSGLIYEFRVSAVNTNGAGAYSTVFVNFGQLSMSDTFDGSTINTSKWVEIDSATGGDGGNLGNVQQSNALTITGNGNWGTNGVTSVRTFNRASGDISVQVTMSGTACSGGNLFEFGYGDFNIYANPGATYLVTNNGGNWYLFYIINGNIVSANGITGVLCSANNPITMRLDVLQVGGARVYVNSSSTPNASTNSGTFTNKGVYLQAYSSGLTTTFDNLYVFSPDQVPDSPSGLSTEIGDGQIGLSWNTPNDNGSAITDYIIEYKSGSESYSTFSDGTSTNTSTTITGLTNGITYTFRISAVSTNGTSSPSLTINAIPITETPTIPSAINLQISGNAVFDETLTASYTYVDANGDDEGVTQFRWLRSDTINGSYAPISGASSNTYLLTSSDLNKYIKFEIIPVSDTAPDTGTAVLSSSIGPVQETDWNHILSTGQSLSLGGGSSLISTQPYSNKMLSGGSFIALVEPATGASGQSISSSLANMISSLVNPNSFNTIVSLHGASATAYSGLKKGTTPYNNGISQVSTAKAAAEALGDTYRVAAITAIHGESDEIAGKTASQYEASLVEWQNDYQTDIQAITEQTSIIPFFTDQMSSWTFYNLTTPDTAIGQLDAAKNNPAKIYLTTPKYIFDYSDGVHLTNYSYRRLGEYYGKVMKKVLVDREGWLPLMPLSIIRGNNIIIARFHVPVEPLAFDTTRVDLKTNYGFEYSDNSSSASITNVELLGSDSVKITLNTTPTGTNQKLRYAYTGTSGSWSGAHVSGSARGNLRDSDTTEALYQDGNVPAAMGNYLYNWSVTFNEDISVDSTAPTVSSVTASSSDSGSTITWATNEVGSSKVDYGLTSSYGSSTSETNTSAGVTSHSVAVSSLRPCSIYHYRVRSKDAVGNEVIGSDNTFLTSGCTGSSSVQASDTQSITTASGGSVDLIESSTGIALTVPTGFAGSDANFQIKRLEKTATLTSTSSPTGYSLIANYLYDMKALSDVNTVISSFNNALTVTMTYTNADITGMQESSLKIYRWDGSSWSALSNCSVNTSAKTVTCTTTAFSVFGLFGQANVTTSTSSNSSSSNSDDDSDDQCSDDVGIQPSWLYSAVTIDSKSIKLQFTEAADPVEYYSIKYGLSSNNYNESKEDIGIKSQSKMEYVVKNLTPNTTYYFKVRGNNGCKFGEWSNEIKATTKSNVSFNTLKFSDSKLEVVETSPDKSKDPMDEIAEPTSCQTHTVSKGDTLIGIANKYYADSTKYKNIAEENKNTYPTLEKSNNLEVGWKLNIGCSDVTSGTSKDVTSNSQSEQEGYKVKVKVINEENKPVEGAKVTMHSKVQEATTNKDGLATFENVEKGDHRVIIAYNGFEGEQALNLTGDVKEFSLEIKVKEQSVLMSPIYLWSMAIAGFIIMVMFILLRNGRK